MLNFEMGTHNDIFCRGAVIALGNFDGMHIGHQEIIKTAIIEARDRNLPAIALTFRPHPAAVLRPHTTYTLINTYEDKISILSSYGLSAIIELDFSLEFSMMSHDDFVRNILIGRFSAACVITGSNFYYGNKRIGNVATMNAAAAQYSFDYRAIDIISYNYRQISSSAIKQCMQGGLIEIANKLLGRTYAITGTVVRGKNIATRELGIATANLNWPSNLIQLTYGVYFVRVTVHQITHYGIANLGIRPTLCADKECILEAHLFNFNQDLYDEQITVEFLSFIRPEYKFDSMQQLRFQIALDIKLCHYLYNTISHN